jgi:hypothetical protein
MPNKTQVIAAIQSTFDTPLPNETKLKFVKANLNNLKGTDLSEVEKMFAKEIAKLQPITAPLNPAPTPNTETVANPPKIEPIQSTDETVTIYVPIKIKKSDLVNYLTKGL